MASVDLGINPGRLLFGLSRIGYTPASAVSDIVDNSVSAGAATVTLLIKKLNPNWTDVRRNNVSEYLIIDDGRGMAFDEMINALALGASEDDYDDGTLSKFGLGLKSAAFSQGDELHVISSAGEGFRKLVLNLPRIRKEGRYFAEEFPLAEEDEALVKEYLPEGRGTIIRIAEVRLINHPNVKETREELISKIGVIYYYFLVAGLVIRLGTMGDELTEIPPFDPLAATEADEHPNLDEHAWDGRTVRWIERKKPLPLDADQGVTATVEVTQLPYPPIFELNNPGGQNQTRDKYRIQAGNYGYYIYRNKRLIDWANGLGIIPQDQDFYSFRGRINIDSTADDAFNIDVKKASIVLSDEAKKVLSEISLEYKRKAKKAWETAGATTKSLRGDGKTEVIANEISALVEPLDDIPGAPLPTDQEAKEQQERDRALATEMKKHLRQSARRQKSLEVGKDVPDQTLTEEDLEKTLKGEPDHPGVKQIFLVPYLDDNVLWEPYYDTDLGACVRIHRGHRFSRLVQEDNETNADLRVLMDVLLHQIAVAEITMRRKFFDDKQLVDRLADFRRLISEQLALLCRQAEDKLPPLKREQRL